MEILETYGKKVKEIRPRISEDIYLKIMSIMDKSGHKNFEEFLLYLISKSGLGDEILLNENQTKYDVSYQKKIDEIIVKLDMLIKQSDSKDGVAEELRANLVLLTSNMQRLNALIDLAIGASNSHPDAGKSIEQRGSETFTNWINSK